METHSRPLHERLGLIPEWWHPDDWLQFLTSYNKSFGPHATDYERASRKFTYADTKGLLALASYYAGAEEAARVYGKEFLQEAEGFFFGDWRNIYLTEDKRTDPKWWMEHLDWIRIFEHVLVWAAVLGEWDYLKRVGGYPEPSIPACGYKEQERNLYLAIGALLSGASAGELSVRLDLAGAGRAKTCKLIVAALRACVSRDTSALNKTLLAYLKHYKKSEFPKQSMTKKVSIEGTFIVHWAEKEGIKVEVPSDFTDHIVRLPK